MCNCGKKRNQLMTTTQILDKVLPYTREELRCGIKKRTKQQQRASLAAKISDYLNGKEVELPENVKVLLNEQARAKRLV